jgi:hypothetical protein
MNVTALKEQRRKIQRQLETLDPARATSHAVDQIAELVDAISEMAGQLGKITQEIAALRAELRARAQDRPRHFEFIRDDAGQVIGCQTWVLDG